VIRSRDTLRPYVVVLGRAIGHCPQRAARRWRMNNTSCLSTGHWNSQQRSKGRQTRGAAQTCKKRQTSLQRAVFSADFVAKRGRRLRQRAGVAAPPQIANESSFIGAGMGMRKAGTRKKANVIAHDHRVFHQPSSQWAQGAQLSERVARPGDQDDERAGEDDQS